MNTFFRYGFFALLLCLLSFSSCRKDYYSLYNPDNRLVDSYEELFSVLWHGMDQCYLFWDRDTTDWDAMYDRYFPVFQKFDEHGYASDAELQNALNAMFGGLIDHHLSLSAVNVSNGHYLSVNPGWNEVSSRDYYHSTWVEQQVKVLKNMDGITNYRAWEGDCPSWFALIPLKDNQKIAYFRFKNFDFTSLVYSVASGRTNYTALDPLKAFYGTALDGMGPSALPNSIYVKGLIIDVRGNGGGNLNEISPLVGSLMQEDLLWGYGRTKQGLGRLDYSAWTPFHVVCPAKHLVEAKPIVVLADCNTGSCGEILTQSVKMLPNGTFVGDRTWGCTGPLLPGQNNLLYSGVFGNIYLGYYVYTSNFDLVGSEYQSFEGKGIEPDIWVDYDEEMLGFGRDKQLEAAIDHIKSQL